VGVDRSLIIWDLRQGNNPVVRLKEVHASDINTVDWSPLDENLIATGSNDTVVKLIDVRKAYAAIVSHKSLSHE
jgi:histone-binding protein RBBP4